MAPSGHLPMPEPYNSKEKEKNPQEKLAYMQFL
jgi:hypothetical protein